MSKHSKTHAHEKQRLRVRREGALGRREADIKLYADENRPEYNRLHKLAAAKREVEVLRKKLGQQA